MQGKLSEAIATWEAVLRDNPEHPDALYNIALAKIQQAQGTPNREEWERALQEAITLWEQVWAKNPSQTNALRNIAVSYALLGDFRASIQRWETLAQADPQNPEPRLNIAELWLRQGQIPEAWPQLEKALALAPKDGRVYFLLGLAHLLGGEKGQPPAAGPRSTGQGGTPLQRVLQNWRQAAALEADFPAPYAGIIQAVLRPEHLDDLERAAQKSKDGQGEKIVQSMRRLLSR